jgi:hypothetical protein
MREYGGQPCAGASVTPVSHAISLLTLTGFVTTFHYSADLSFQLAGAL